MTITEGQLPAGLLDAIRGGIYGPDVAWAIQNVGPPIGVAVAVLRWLDGEMDLMEWGECDVSTELVNALDAVRQDSV